LTSFVYTYTTNQDIKLVHKTSSLKGVFVKIPENKRIAVTGMGIVTRFGGTQETIDGVFSGKSQIAQLPKEFSLCPTQIGGYIENFNLSNWFDAKETKRIEKNTRPSQFSHAAIKQALNQAKLLQEDNKLHSNLRERTGICMGTGVGASELIAKLAVQMHLGNMQELIKDHIGTAMNILPDASAYQPSITFGIQGPIDCSIKACATGAGNIRRAAMEIFLDQADIMIAGATESLAPVDVMAFNVYARRGALSHRNNDPEKASRPFDKDHDGFVPSEGAGVVILEEYEHAIKRGAKILAELAAYGETTDAKGRTDPDKDSQVRAMRMALEMANVGSDEVNVIKTHGTSTINGDASELEAIKEMFAARENLFIWAPKSTLGHTLGASGAIEAALLIAAIQRGIVPPTINLDNPIPETSDLKIPISPIVTEIRYAVANSFGFGGQNVTLIFKTPI
jgi:3-oxoacyl-[acyl-carrier-protein] synthase II